MPTRKYYQEHREELLEKGRIYFKLNKERMKERMRESGIKWRARNPDYKKNRADIIRRNQRERRSELKRIAFDVLGGRCNWSGCEWKDPQALQIDHINGGGNMERKIINELSAYYKNIIANKSNYQLLCANHNWIKRIESGEQDSCGIRFSITSDSPRDDLEKIQRRRSNLKKKRQEARVRAIEFLGGKCAWDGCGWNDIRALQIDHINRGGSREFRLINDKVKYYNQVIEHPEKYQVLCANHNWIKRIQNKEYCRRDGHEKQNTEENRTQ